MGSGGGRKDTGTSWTYLKVEAVKSWAELLFAGQTVLLTAAGHAGEEAEQQELTEQDVHGAGAGGTMLNTSEGGGQLEQPVCGGLIQGTWERRSSEGTVPGPEIHLPGGAAAAIRAWCPCGG